MATPRLVTVRGTYLKLDGTPEVGTVNFRSQIFTLHGEGATVVAPGSKDVTLDSTGSFSIQLPSTDDPNWSPVGWTYEITVRLSDSYYVFSTGLPYDLEDGILDVSELTPVASGGGTLYAAIAHEHSEYITAADIADGLGDEFSTLFAPINHTHAAAAIVSGTIALARLPVGSGANQVAAGDHTHNYDSVYAGIGHIHNQYATTASPTFTGTVSGINRGMVGLGNVDNTSDANKPISTATTTALALKADLVAGKVPESQLPPASTSGVSSVAGRSGEVVLTKSDVELANVDNTSDVNKPISTATTTALNNKADLVSGKVPDAQLPTPLVSSVAGKTGTVALAKADVGLGNVDNTSDANKPVSTATQSAIDTAQAAVAFTANAAYDKAVNVETALEDIDKTSVGLANVDNTSDVNKPISTAQQSALDLKANLASPTFTGTVSGVSKSMVGLGNADNTSDANKPVSTAQQTALNLKANLASPTFTGTVAGITKTMVGLANVDNTTDANKPVSTAQQTALNLKANIASPTFTGTVSGITKSMVGLANVDNTADTAKPISTATQTALDAKTDVLVLGPGDPIPGGTRVGTVIVRTV